MEGTYHTVWFYFCPTIEQLLTILTWEVVRIASGQHFNAIFDTCNLSHYLRKDRRAMPWRKAHDGAIHNIQIVIMPLPGQYNFYGVCCNCRNRAPLMVAYTHTDPVEWVEMQGWRPSIMYRLESACINCGRLAEIDALQLRTAHFAYEMTLYNFEQDTWRSHANPRPPHFRDLPHSIHDDVLHLLEPGRYPWVEAVVSQFRLPRLIDDDWTEWEQAQLRKPDPDTDEEDQIRRKYCAED